MDIHLPKFLICDTHENQNLCFLLHTQFPKFLAIVHNEFENEEEEMNCKRNYPVGASVEIDGQTEVIGVIQWYDGPNGNADEIAKLMSAMGDWYVKEIESY